MDWNVKALERQVGNIIIVETIDEIILKLKAEARYGGHFVLMSNGSFGGIYKRLQDELM